MALPIGGGGVVPGSNTQLFTELNALTRRAFIRRLVVQLYSATPTLMVLMGGAQKSAGGLNQITIPVQGASMVQGAWAGYAGNFPKPAVIPGTQAAAFNTAYFLIPVPLVMGEALLQSTEAIIPILDARMNDVYAIAMQQMGSALFSNNTANPQMPNSLIDGIDNGTNVAIYGGINRTSAGNQFWQSQYYPNAGAVLTRKLVSQYIIQATDVAGGETPTFGVMSPSDFAALNSDFIGAETIFTDPNAKYTEDMDARVRSSFPNLWVAGVPLFMDHFCPKGTMYFINTKYLAMYLSEDAAFEFSGFFSAIPTFQLAQVGVAIVGYNVINAKPVASAQITGITGGAF